MVHPALRERIERIARARGLCVELLKEKGIGSTESLTNLEKDRLRNSLVFRIQKNLGVTKYLAIDYLRTLDLF